IVVSAGAGDRPGRERLGVMRETGWSAGRSGLRVVPGFLILRSCAFPLLLLAAEPANERAGCASLRPGPGGGFLVPRRAPDRRFAVAFPLGRTGADRGTTT